MDGLHGQLDSKRRQSGDLQKIDSGLERVLGVEGIGEPRHQPFEDARAFSIAQRPAQLVAERLDRRACRSECLPHLNRAALPFAGADASPFGDGVGEGEVGRQQRDCSAQVVVVTRAELHHRLAEHTPGCERRAPGHALHRSGGPLPFSGVHGVDTLHDRPGVAPQRVARIEDIETVPAPVDHEQVRERPFRPQRGGPNDQESRVDRQSIGSVQASDVPHQVLVSHRREGDGLSLQCGLRVHGGGLSFQTALRELPGALDAGAEAQERPFLRTTVSVLRLPEPVECAAPVAVVQELPDLIQQDFGGYVLRFRSLSLALAAAVFARCHACVVCEPLSEADS